MRAPKLRLHSFIVRALIGASADALLALIAYRLGLNLATTSLLFLLAVVVQALGGGVVSSLIASLVAAGFLDYFFVPPVLTLRIADPFNAVALIAFVTTSLVITNLASKARRAAGRAERRHKALEDLYKASQRLLWMDPNADVIPTILTTFREVLGLRAACFFDGTTAKIQMDGGSARLSQATRGAYIAGSNRDSANPAFTVRCLHHGGRVTGAIGFEALQDAELTAGPLVNLTIATLDRALAYRDASEATAEAQAEVFRTAVLDGLAHEFKTPLAVIQTAAGGLRETGPLTEQQQEMAEAIEEEAERLAGLTTRLLRKTEIDREQINPNMARSDIELLTRGLVERYATRPSGRRIRMESDEEPAIALVDEELFSLALSQLLDNAVKYSRPDSPITVTLGSERPILSVRVSNQGLPIPASERDQIFERFYRGSDGQRSTTGSGLGLYVSRKIARAHGGTLELVPDGCDRDCTTFCLTLPLLQSEVSLDADQLVSRG
jgi:two-component system sensor histidine kinase KdpD